jgi:hypothetical protein
MIYDPFRRRPLSLDDDANDSTENFATEAEPGIAATKDYLRSLVEDPDYWKHKKPDAIARADAAFKAAYGGGYLTDATGKLIRTEPKPIDFVAFAPPRQKEGFVLTAKPGVPPLKNGASFLVAGRGEKHGTTAASPAVWRGGTPPIRDLRYDPSRDKPDIVLAQEPRDPLHDGAPPDDIEAQKRHFREVDRRSVQTDYQWPVRGHAAITSQYGMRQLPHEKDPRLHAGTDMYAEMRTDVHAVGRGFVIAKGTQLKQDGTGYGKYIMIRHDNGDVSVYAHLDEQSARWRIGDYITDEQARNVPIGKSGTSGTNSPHLHFEMWRGEYRTRGGISYDPMTILRHALSDAERLQNQPHPGFPYNGGPR